MSDISKYTTRFRVQKNPAQVVSSQKSISRESFACDQCRSSKLKCDRAKPCERCVKRGGEASCSYRPSTAQHVGSARGTSAEDRLDHLESLVKQLIRSQPARDDIREADRITPPTSVSLSGDLGQETASDKEGDTGYFGSTHWSAIIEDIQELKHILKSKVSNAVEAIPESDLLSREHEVIFGSSSNYSIHEILRRYMPPRVHADRLLSTYFSGDAVIFSTIHLVHFERQYRDFWEAPDRVNPLWLSILFSVFYMASIVENPVGSDAMRSDFHIAAGKCLVLGEYHRPQQYGPEALAFYAHGKSLKSLEPSRETATILGISIRIAYEMGFHREPDPGKVSVFEAEMRRRFWSSCKQIDLMVSFQLGLPSNVRFDSCDVQSPRNLLDTDFDIDTLVLPPSRPDTEDSRLLWIIVKDRLVPSFGKVCAEALSVHEKPETVIMKLDHEVRMARTTIPEIYRARPVADSIGSTPFQIMTRAYIDILSLKSLCVLHRKYMNRGNQFSTRACIEAGIAIVSQIVDIYKEFAPGGIMHGQKWLFAGYTMNDFLLGVVVLCSYVHLSRKSSLQNDAFALEMVNEVLRLLEQSQFICSAESKACRDARRVSVAIKLTLRGLPSPGAGEKVISRVLPLETRRDLLTSPILEATNHGWHMEDIPFESLDPFGFMGNDFFNFDAAMMESGPWDQNDLSLTNTYVPE